MKRINLRLRAILACFSCLTVVFATMVLALWLSRMELSKEAFKTADAEAVNLGRSVNTVFLSTHWVLNSFLTSFSDIESAETAAEGNSLFNKSYKRIIRQPTLDYLDAKAIEEMLESFIAYNDEMYSCILIFEPGVLKNVPEGIARAAFSDSRQGEDLLENYEIYNSEFYRKVSDSGMVQYKVEELNVDGKKMWTCTIGMPICDSSGRVVGQCWSDLTLDRMSGYLSAFKFQNDYALFIIMPDGTVMCSANPDSHGKPLDVALKMFYPNDFPHIWYKTMMAVIAEGNGSEGRFSSEIKGDRVETYYGPILRTDFKIVVVKSESRVLKMAGGLHKRMLYIFLVAYLLLAAFLFYLYYALRRESIKRSRMQDDLELAYNIQRGLLPPNPAKQDESFDIYGFLLPAKSIGGDMYGFFLKNDKLHFCIGDVSGKGVSAALLMAEILSTYRYIAKRNDNVLEIVSSLNNSSLDSSVNRNICTMVVGVLDLVTGRLDYCNAGHNPPVLLSGGSPDFIPVKPNMPLFAFDDYPFCTQSIDLKPGDSLFLYTDGVTDAMNSHKKMFGQKAFLSFIGRQGSRAFPKMIDGLLAEIKKFAGRTPQFDDITMLCIKYKGKKI